jgi:hypothetical protein
MKVNFEKILNVKSGKDLEYDLKITVVGESNIKYIKEQEKNYNLADLDSKDFNFYCIETPTISNINYNIKNIKLKKGSISKNKFRALPNCAKKAGRKKINRFINNYKNWEDSLCLKDYKN